MNWNEVDEKARLLIEKDSSLVRRHLDYLRRMVAIDSRSFGVGEFEGDRKTPSDMKEFLSLAEEYLRAIGFPFVKVNKRIAGRNISGIRRFFYPANSLVQVLRHDQIVREN